MTHQQMWERFSRESGITQSYEAWSFGADADELAHLVLKREKTATASARCLYQHDGSDLPMVGQYSVVLDAGGNAVCIIRTVRVYTVPFAAVSEDHAWKEGEGDRSLTYWRKVHEDFFRNALGETNFDPSMDVVCEEFVRVFP